LRSPVLIARPIVIGWLGITPWIANPTITF
jgi:hypothetical protein